MRFVKRALLSSIFLVVLSLNTTLLRAQTETATVSGRVTDSAGAVVPDVDVQLVNKDTSIAVATKTNRDGIYAIPSVKPGPYRILVVKDGFKEIVKTGLILNVQDSVVENFSLQVGSVSESVTVTSDQLNINTTDATVSTVVDRQFAENLPLNGRSFQTLIELTPGVVLTAPTGSDNGQFSVNGQRAASNYWMVDGVSANIGVGIIVGGGAAPGNGFAGAIGSYSALGGTNSLVSVDALQEFRIQTSTYAPEFGRTPGGQISILTRSGTNQFHGTAFDYLRNDVLDANNWFANATGQSKPEERQNDFGGTLGGPILRDRTFFFFSYEGLRLRLPETALTTVPDASFTPGGTTNSRENAAPAMQPYLNSYPLPGKNSPEIFTTCDPTSDPTCPPSGQKPTGTAALNASYSDPATLDAYSLRLDDRATDNLNLFGRYNYSPSETVQRGANGGPLNDSYSARITTQTFTLGASWTPSPSFSNDFRFNYSRNNATGNAFSDNFNGAIPLTSLPFPSPYTASNGLFFMLTNSLNTGAIQLGYEGENIQRQINAVDSMVAQRGTHSLKFGVDFRRLTPINYPGQYFQIVFFDDVPSLMQGASSLSVIEADVSSYPLFRNLGVFAQDTWLASPRLTLTYGLRWDVDFTPATVKGPSFPAVTNFNNLSNLMLAPAGTPPFTTTYGNVAPRLGIAYQIMQNPRWQTVIRGGFGVFYDMATQEAGNVLTSGSGSYPFGSVKYNFTDTAFPLTPASSAPLPITPESLASGRLGAFDPNLKLPYTLEWNFALEQAIGVGQTISASYLGAAGRRLIQTAVYDTLPNPNIASADLVGNGGTSDYEALQIQFKRQLTRGLQALASYTFSHSIDTASSGSADSSFLPGESNANRGPSDFDIRHAFSAAATYDIPAPKTNLIAKALLRDWSWENILLVRSAAPVDVVDGNYFGFSTGIQAAIRPDLVPGQPLYLTGSQYPGGKAINPSAFKDPPSDPTTGFPLRQGTLGRNALRGFGATQWDLAIHRSFPLHESVKLQFRAEMFNVLNHPNFGPPNQTFGFAGFGISQTTLAQSLANGNTGNGGFSPLYQIGGPRAIQFALKLIF